MLSYFWNWTLVYWNCSLYHCNKALYKGNIKAYTNKHFEKSSIFYAIFGYYFFLVMSLWWFVVFPSDPKLYELVFNKTCLVYIWERLYKKENGFTLFKFNFNFCPLKMTKCNFTGEKTHNILSEGGSLYESLFDGDPPSCVQYNVFMRKNNGKE